MPWPDLRTFLAALESRGDLLRISEPVDPEYEVVALTRRTSDVDGPALLFENVKGASTPCLSGLFAAKRRVAWALEVGERELEAAYREREGRLIEPVTVDGPGACQEIVLTGDQIDLFSLPILRHYERDGGRYITAGLQIARDPQTGSRNVSIHRMLLLDRNRLTVFAPLGRHLRTIIERYHDEGRPAEIATVIGTEPAAQIGSQARVAYGVDELAVAGGLRGAPIELVRGCTIDVDIPATSEIVIEGRTVPGESVVDGPFGEYPGTYSDAKPAPVLEVTAITMRSGAVYQNTLTGMPMTENHWMMQAAAAAMAYREAFKVTPEVREVNVTPGGAARHHVVISIRKRHASEARNVMLALLAAPLGAKLVTVVDEDIDVFDPLQVEWAVNTRVQADRDVIVLPNLYSPTLDPSAPAQRTSAKMGIDATVPLGEGAEYQPARIVGFDRFRLDPYLQRAGWHRPDGAALTSGSAGERPR
ncbi:MAG TPA: UbiD family decarboxylase [Candidatus Limnocylindrales bacterium]|nr:UbiD family decarboxylase [Candidatus Limnocylindrales bacterium]